MEFKGTKGKWRYEVKFGKNRPRITVQIPVRDDWDREIILGTISDDECTVNSCCCVEEHANALLISKAPEMLDMLIKMKNNDDWQIEDYLEIEQLIEEATKID